MAWLCIDAGTTFIKAVLLDENGRELAVERKSVAVERRCANYAEQDMMAVWEATIATARAITQRSIAAVEGIVTTAQGDGCWLVDVAGTPVGPAILWNDGRAYGTVETWRSAGVIDEAFRVSGSVTYPGLANSILRWLHENEPDRLQRARWLLSCNGWLYQQMTGEITADLSDAANPFGDVVERRYAPELIKIYELEQYACLLPEISRIPIPVAALRPQSAAAFGVQTGVPVVMAPYDIVTTAFGCGCLNAGEGCLILGTTLCPEVVTTDAGRNGTSAGTTIPLQETSHYLRAMPTLTGCEALDWAANMLGAGSVEDLSRMAARSGVGAKNVMCLPYFSPAGERSPFLAPAARGSWLGMSFTHLREDAARAVFEGLSFVIRECFAAASATPLSRVAVCGGGSRSEFWCQMITDVCGCEVMRPYASEVGARGALFSAFVATGRAKSLQEAVQQCGVDGQLYVPDSKQVAAYQDLFSRFLRLRDRVAVTWEAD